MAAYKQEELRLAKEVNVIDYLRSQGYELERSDGNNHHLKIHDSLKIRNDGKVFIWYSRDAKGDQIELVRELEGVGLVDAVKKLAVYAGGGRTSAVHAIHTEKKQPEAVKNQSKSETTDPPKKVFTLPEKNENHKRAFAYLEKTRGIDSHILSLCFERGLIYESKGYHNAVFVGQKNEQGEAKHASQRGTSTMGGKAFKGDVTGSDKAYSFALAGKGNEVVVCESAIDVLSHASLDRINGKAWTDPHRVALGGMSDASLKHYLSEHPEIKKLTFHLDNDKDGKDGQGNSVNHGQVRAAALMKHYAEQGYAVSNVLPKQKDLNEELQAVLAEKATATQGQMLRENEIFSRIKQDIPKQEVKSDQVQKFSDNRFQKVEEEILPDRERKPMNAKNVSMEVAEELFSKNIPVYVMDQENEIKQIQTREELAGKEGRLMMNITDMDRYQDLIPEIRERYLTTLFREGFKIDPLDTLDLFGHQVNRKGVSELVLAQKNPALQEQVEAAVSRAECFETVDAYLKQFDQIKGAKVQIMNSEHDAISPCVIEFPAANARLKQCEESMRLMGNQEGGTKCYEVNFRLYTEESMGWRCREGVCRIGDGYQTDLMSFMEKEFPKSTYDVCEKEIRANNKKQYQAAMKAVRKDEKVR